jgi:uncharacterized membrane protein
MARVDGATVAAMGIFTALVAASTIVISAYVPSTRGYFNVGEIMIYTSAILLGPIVGGFAGGVGSMIADLTLGFAAFAPGTLVIKGAEGLLVGWLALQVRKRQPKAITVRFLAIISAVVASVLIFMIGSNLLIGDIEFTLAFPGMFSTVVGFSVPIEFWVGVSIIAFVGAMIGAVRLDSTLGAYILTILAGGSVMVTGYFLYEFFILSLAWAALLEIPVNLGQVTVGLMVGTPLVKGVLRVYPALANRRFNLRRTSP